MEINFCREETVLARNEFTLNKNNFDDFKEYLKCNAKAYQELKDLTFEDWCAIANGDKDDLEWTEKISTPDFSWSYQNNGMEILKDYMRDAAFSNDAIYEYIDMNDYVEEKIYAE